MIKIFIPNIQRWAVDAPPTGFRSTPNVYRATKFTDEAAASAFCRDRGIFHPKFISVAPSKPATAKVRLSKRQSEALREILSAPVGTPDTVCGWTWKCEKDHTLEGCFTWHAGMVYGRFNTATLRALERVGLIKVHNVGGAQMPDTIEVLPAAACAMEETMNKPTTERNET